MTRWHEGMGTETAFSWWRWWWEVVVHKSAERGRRSVSSPTHSAFFLWYVTAPHTGESVCVICKRLRSNHLFFGEFLRVSKVSIWEVRLRPRGHRQNNMWGWTFWSSSLGLRELWQTGLSKRCSVPHLQHTVSHHLRKHRGPEPVEGLAL